MTTENHSGSIPLLDMGVGPAYAPGEESNMGGIVYEFRVEEAAKSYVRLSAAAARAAAAGQALSDVVHAHEFLKRVRLPGSAFVARQFGRLEAWKAARVERQAQAAVGPMIPAVGCSLRVSETSIIDDDDPDAITKMFKIAKRGVK